MMEIGFDYLSNDVILEQSAPQRVGKELVLIAYAQHEAGETGVMKIELWTLDDPLIEVSGMRREREKDEACLQNRNPPPGCVYGNTTVGCEGRVIQ
jgi:hypothetical protein